MKKLNAAALMLMALVTFASATSAEVIAIPGTKVSIEPPPDFFLSKQFPGVQNAALGSSIMVTELPAPVDGITDGFTKEGLLSRGMMLQSSEEATVAGLTGRLVSVTQTSNGAVFEKWIAAFGNASATVLVVATYPESLASQLAASMRAAVLSAVWEPDRKVDTFEGLSFSLRESEHLKIQKRVQNMLLLAPSAPGVTSPGSEPFAIVGSSHSPMQIDDLELFSRQRITQTSKLADLRDIEGDSVTIAGRPAYEIRAKAKDRDSGEGIAIYQLVLIDGQTYYLMQAMVAEGRFDEYLPEFKAIARSIEIR